MYSNYCSELHNPKRITNNRLYKVSIKYSDVQKQAFYRLCLQNFQNFLSDSNKVLLEYNHVGRTKNDVEDIIVFYIVF